MVVARRDVAVPGRGNADGIEARRLHAVDQCLRGRRVAPGGFAALGFERVAKIPASPDVAGDGLRGRELGVGRSGNGRERATRKARAHCAISQRKVCEVT